MSKKIGILGSGQLAMLFCKAAKKLNLESIVLAQNKDDPACTDSDEVIIGEFNEKEAIAKFYERADFVVYENEFVASESIPIKFFAKTIPHPEVMELLRSKLRQKKLLRDHHIPTSDFVEFNADDFIDPNSGVMDRITSELGNSIVIKTATGGYDGKGVCLVQDFRDSICLQSAIEFVSAQRAGLQFYAEKLVPFSVECAQLSFRSKSGEVKHYPAVETIQQNGVCTAVRGGGDILGEEVKEQMRFCAERFATASGIVGAFAIEFFVLPKGPADTLGNVLVNEIAPRVHNSAHWTCDAAVYSQFEAHLLCALGREASVELKHPFFAMINLLGPRLYKGEIHSPIIPKDLAHSARIEWYNKSESRPGRKLGHINIWAKDLEDLEETRRALHQAVQDWSTPYEKIV